MIPQLLVWGNPADGFDFIGPFESAEEACEYAKSDHDIRNSEWWIVDLHAPAFEKDRS